MTILNSSIKQVVRFHTQAHETTPNLIELDFPGVGVQISGDDCFVSAT